MAAKPIEETVLYSPGAPVEPKVLESVCLDQLLCCRSIRLQQSALDDVASSCFDGSTAAQHCKETEVDGNMRRRRCTTSLPQCCPLVDSRPRNASSSQSLSYRCTSRKSHHDSFHCNSAASPTCAFSCCLSMAARLCVLVLWLAIAASSLPGTHALPTKPRPQLMLKRAVRATHRDDVIGYYTQHPGSGTVVDNSSCPLTLTVSTFWFRVSEALSLIEAPDNFNLFIPYEMTTADNNACSAGGGIPAVPHNHPFVEDPADVIRAWASVGDTANGPLAWLTLGKQPSSDIDNIPIVKAASKAAFVVGYDFTERTCLATRIPAPVAYLWFQPPEEVNIGPLNLSPADKLLILAFGGAYRNRGCIYVAQRVGGQAPYGAGPNADDSNPDETFAPRPDPSYEPETSPPPGISPPAGFESASPSVTPSPSPAVVESEASPTDSNFASPTPTGPIFGGPVENDVEGPLGGSAGGVSRSCFPAGSLATLSDGSSLPLQALRAGHSVVVSSPQQGDDSLPPSSEVFFFSHRILEGDYHFLNITVACAECGSLIVTPDHYVYISGKSLLPAREVRPNVHSLVLANGTSVLVSSVSTVVSAGLVAPHTLHGDLVVDGYVVSTYTKAVNPRFAHHVLLAPVRLLYQLGLVSWLQPWFDYGASHLASYMPLGPNSLQRFTALH